VSPAPSEPDATRADAPLAVAGPTPRVAQAAPAVEAEADDLTGIAHLLQPGETVILLLKPSLLFVPLASLHSLLTIAFVTFFLAWLDRIFPHLPGTDHLFIALGVLCGIVRLLWQVLEWATRVYVLTDRRIIRRRGVIRVSVFECQLANVQQTAVLQSLRERVFFLGTLCFATAGAASFIALWEFVSQPFEVQRTVAEAIDRYTRR
jgi:uncharacterized membrane protein YdbT with pleckstrin-like domain